MNVKPGIAISVMFGNQHSFEKFLESALQREKIRTIH